MQSYLVGFHPVLQKINIFDQKDTEAATVGVLWKKVFLHWIQRKITVSVSY